MVSRELIGQNYCKKLGSGALEGRTGELLNGGASQGEAEGAEAGGGGEQSGIKGGRN